MTKLTKQQLKDAIATVNRLVNEKKTEELYSFLDKMSGSDAVKVMFFSCFNDENLIKRSYGSIVIEDDDDVQAQFYEISYQIKNWPKSTS